MNIKILCVGKIKEKYLRDGIAEYLKRLGRYAKVTVHETSDEKTPEEASEAQVRQIKEKEGERLLKFIAEGDYCIAMAIDGKKYDSVGFSEHLESLMNHGESTIDLVIGGSLGLSDAVLKRADEKISFSDLTFPHQLMRLILTEQIYRAFRIMKHEPYHK
ncbi:MAG: 23S rRNA (pseudouridine(1915)-N(3))-methyltransferase RlmH [Lachnospiraceae bacterium]|nr:23S rRNA (pseudouridine(1915)-N(3))-methyltransferase RlmH [Lachnospiraceae bacterium]